MSKTQWQTWNNTGTPQPPAETPTAAAAPTARPKKRRWFMWTFLAIQALFLIWVIAGARSGAGTPDDCGTLSQQSCNDAQNTGTAIGVGLVILLWAITDIILGITYAIIRVARR